MFERLSCKLFLERRLTGNNQFVCKPSKVLMLLTALYHTCQVSKCFFKLLKNMLLSDGSLTLACFRTTALRVNALQWCTWMTVFLQVFDIWLKARFTGSHNKLSLGTTGSLKPSWVRTSSGTRLMAPLRCTMHRACKFLWPSTNRTDCRFYQWAHESLWRLLVWSWRVNCLTMPHS